MMPVDGHVIIQVSNESFDTATLHLASNGSCDATLSELSDG